MLSSYVDCCKLFAPCSFCLVFTFELFMFFAECWCICIVVECLIESSFCQRSGVKKFLKQFSFHVKRYCCFDQLNYCAFRRIRKLCHGLLSSFSFAMDYWIILRSTVVEKFRILKVCKLIVSVRLCEHISSKNRSSLKIFTTTFFILMRPGASVTVQSQN